MHDILTIGTATRDIFLKTSGGREIEEKDKLPAWQFPGGRAMCLPLAGKIEVSEMESRMGGGAVNAAITFSRQGLKTATLIGIGNDEEGKEIVKEIKKEKISVYPQRSRLKTATSHILLSDSGERTILVFRGASVSLRAVSLPLAKWAYIVPGGISVSDMEKIFSSLAKKEVSVAFNPSKKYISLGAEKLKNMLSKCRVVIMNREEASYLTGVHFEKEKDIFGKLDELVKGIVVMTDGPRGAIVSDGKHLFRAGIFPEKKLVDRTGAGDAFGSGFVAGLIQKEKDGTEEAIKYGIKLGSANAASVVEKIGAEIGILTRKEFESGSRWRKLPIFTTEV